ncbi:RNA polymerase sigma factor [Formosa sediminum]|nr:sigma-70 family RNA polymerase sigma factor [Formosa sediminum]
MMQIRGVNVSNAVTEDLLLFKQIQLGNPKAVDVLFKKYYHSLCRFGILYESNIHIIEEKASDVFMILWKEKHKLHTIKNPKSYIYVILKNNLRKPCKNHKIRPILHEDQFENQNLYPSIEDEIIANEQLEINKHIIRTILNEIPKRTRQIFEMSRIDGFKYKEISELLDIAPKTVENHIGLALKYISKGLITYK